MSSAMLVQDVSSLSNTSEPKTTSKKNLLTNVLPLKSSVPKPSITTGRASSIILDPVKQRELMKSGSSGIKINDNIILKDGGNNNASDKDTDESSILSKYVNNSGGDKVKQNLTARTNTGSGRSRSKSSDTATKVLTRTGRISIPTKLYRPEDHIHEPQLLTKDVKVKQIEDSVKPFITPLSSDDDSSTSSSHHFQESNLCSRMMK